MYEAVKENRLRLIWCYGRYHVYCYHTPSSQPTWVRSVGAEVVYTVQDQPIHLAQGVRVQKQCTQYRIHPIHLGREHDYIAFDEY